MQTKETQTVQNESGSSTKEISAVDIINMMLTFWWFIAILAILVGGSTYLYFKVTAVPEYKSTSQILITTESQQTSTDVNTGAMTGARNLLPTYIAVLESKTFLTVVSDDLDNEYKVSSIKGMIEFTGVEDTNIIKLEVTNEDAHLAYLVASSIVNNAPDEIARVFGGGNSKITEYPEESSSALPLNTARNAIIGFLIGAALAMAIVFLVNMFDTRVKSKDELVTKYHLPILGEVPTIISGSSG